MAPDASRQIRSNQRAPGSVFAPMMRHNQHRLAIRRTPVCRAHKQHPPLAPKLNLAIANCNVIIILVVILHLNQPQTSKLVVAQVGAALHSEQAAVLASSSAQHRQQVSFAEPENDNNVQRVAVGRPVRFRCVVNNIGDHKVAWFHKDRHILLAIDNKTIAWRERIQVSSQADSVFVLQIDSVQLSDKGHYICQLNTQPARSQTHILDVVKSPQIREHETTINIEPVKEFSPVELRCIADGIPKPTIKWRRESQTFELPIYDDIEPDTNELDDRHEPEHKVGETSAGDRLRKDVDSFSPPLNGSLPSTQVASQTSEPTADNTHTNSIRTDAIAETTKTVVKRHSGASPELDKNCSPNCALSRLEQVEQSAKLGPADARWQAALDAAAAAPERRRAPLMMTARRRLIARSAASREQNWRQRHHEQDDDGAQLQSIDSDLVLAGRSDTPTTLASATTTTMTTPPGTSSRPFIGEGETLRIERVSRYDMGYYMCIASNGVPPSVSQRIFLPVSYVLVAKNTNQTSTPRAKESSAAGERSAANNNAGLSDGNSSDRSVKVRGDGTKVSHAERTQAVGTPAEPNWGVGSGRFYHRHRQLKAARSSSVSSASSPSVAALATTTKAVLFALATTLAVVLMV